MDKKPLPPSYFKTKKWALFLTSMACAYLWYQFSEQTIDIIDKDPFKKSLGYTDEESSPELKAIKRWTKIFIVLMSGAAITGQISGMIAGLRQYSFCVNAHVWINGFVGVVVVLVVLKLLIMPITVANASLPDYQVDLWVKILVVFAWLVNIVVGIMFRRDMQMIHHQEKMSRCTCSYIHAMQAQMAQAQAHSASNQMNQVPVGGPGQMQSQYITGPDGSRYVISRPPSSMGPQQRPSSVNGQGDGMGPPNDWIMMNQMNQMP